MTIWALTDTTAGHNAHTLGLAQALGLPFEEKKLAYGWRAKLPNGLIGASLGGLANAHSITAPWPHLVIATGRKTVPVMRYIKRRSPTTKLIQCLWPGRFEPFDAIIVPEHDNPPTEPRIITSNAALHALNDAALKDAALTFLALFERYPKPHIGVLIGGHSKGKKASLSDLHHLIDTCELLAGDGSLIITTSRRTPKGWADAIRDRLTCPYYLYEPASHEPNPYRGILALCDAIATSGDSISMLSEACYSATPVWVDDSFASMHPKHHRFCAELIATGHAIALRADLDKAWQPAHHLDETHRIAQTLKEKLQIHETTTT